jgi:hypothetical protein
MAKHPAAFINAIAEARDFDEALKHLQDTWDELCDLKAEHRRHNQPKESTTSDMANVLGEVTENIR